MAEGGGNPFARRNDLVPDTRISVLDAAEIRRVIEGTTEIERRFFDSIRPGSYIYYRHRDTNKMSARLLVKRVFRTREKNLLMFELVFVSSSIRNNTDYKSFVISAEKIANLYQEVDPALLQLTQALQTLNGGEKEKNPFVT
jgi:hypothetical protein